MRGRGRNEILYDQATEVSGRCRESDFELVQQKLSFVTKDIGSLPGVIHYACDLRTGYMYTYGRRLSRLAVCPSEACRQIRGALVCGRIIIAGRSWGAEDRAVCLGKAKKAPERVLFVIVSQIFVFTLG